MQANHWRKTRTRAPAGNLSTWNSLALEVPSLGVVVEYVHIQPGSALVKVGDAVVAGQALCLSGGVGFAPEPHLHIEVHSPDDMRGPSLRFELAPSSPAEPRLPGATPAKCAEAPPLPPPQSEAESVASGAATATAAVPEPAAAAAAEEAATSYVPVAGLWYGPCGPSNEPAP